MVITQQVVHLCRVHASVLGIVTPAFEGACHRGEPVLRVVVHDLEVDNKVTRHVRKVSVLFVQMLPRCQVPEQFVVHLVQHQEPKLGVVELLYKLTSVHLVTSIGTCGWYGWVVHDVTVPDHQHTSKRGVLRVPHDGNNGFGKPLLLC